MVLGDLESLSPAIVVFWVVLKFGRCCVAVVRAMTKWGRVGVVFSRLRRKSLKRPHEVTSALSDKR